MDGFDVRLWMFAAPQGGGAPFLAALLGMVGMAYGVFILRRDVFPRRQSAAEPAEGGDVVAGVLLFRRDAPPIPAEWAWIVGAQAWACGCLLAAHGLGLSSDGVVMQSAAWIAAVAAWPLPIRLWKTRWRPRPLESALPGSGDRSGEPPPADAPPPGPEERLAGWLAEGETLLWTGGPDPSRFRRDAAWVFVLGAFGVCVGAFFVHEAAANYTGQGYALRLLPWTLLGLEAGACIVVLGFLAMHAAWGLRPRLGKIVYAVTDRRGLLLCQGWWLWNPVPVKSPPAGGPMEFTPQQMAGGRRVKCGRRTPLVFLTEVVRESKNTTTTHYGFHGLARPEEAEASIEQAFGALRPAGDAKTS